MKHLLPLAGFALCAAPLLAQSKLSEWPQHSEERPKPVVVTPGAPFTVAPPSDAVVLFDGRSLEKWTQGNGAPAKWRVVDGAFEAVPGTGTLSTRDSYGDVQLHIEWASPNPPKGTGQDR
ncbi:MAG TPA: family 16 glycoside hydrolase, partial [Gemmatimonadaceae bacterium]|nr:family 16 glycoside hydrolase [Gemmatimonadaceae bacterium]